MMNPFLTGYRKSKSETCHSEAGGKADLIGYHQAPVAAPAVPWKLKPIIHRSAYIFSTAKYQAGYQCMQALRLTATLCRRRGAGHLFYGLAARTINPEGNWSLSGDARPGLPEQTIFQVP